MARNVEIKARIRSLDEMHQRLSILSDRPAQLIIQEDKFFQVERGSLKLRKFNESHAQLIYYQRDNALGPKLSNYQIADSDSPADLESVLSQALVVRGTVKKKRWLFKVGSTRIHLDEVESLGAFIEIEVVLNDDTDFLDGQALAAQLMETLEIEEIDLIKDAYIDLLEVNHERNQHFSSP
jgi:predicted adenylyl cyclase CyaB